MYETCECMIKEGPNGEDICRKCGGDFHACECPAIHSPRCEFSPDHEEWKKGFKSSWNMS